jgi:signal transduction histidine kinase
LEKASIYTEKGLKLAEKEDDKTIESKFNAYFGRIYNTKSSYDTALVYWEKALDLAIEAKDEEQEASANRGIGILYARQEKFIPALECFKKALSIYENTDNKQNSIVIMSNIATTYRVMENEERAVYYLEKAKNMAEEIDDAHGKMVAYTELGAIYHKRAYTENEQGNVERALEYELKAHEISLRLGNKAYQVSTSQALNAIYSNYLEDEDTALKYAEKSLQAARELGDPKMIIAALSALSTSYFAQKRYRECKVAALEGWEIDSTDINIGSNLLSRIILTDIALCDKDNAEVFFAKYKDLFTRHIVQNDREIIADMEVKYETEKKEMRIASLEKERQLYVWLGVAGALFVFALIIVLWQTIRNARKERLLIATRSVLDGEMRERARLSQDLHDRLSGNLSAVKMELANQAESLQNVRDKLDKCIREVREAAHDMMPSSLQFGMKVALEDFTAQFPDVRFHFFGKENRLEKRIEFVVYCCASELVTNAIRHSGAKHINVQLVQGEKHVALTVQDDGCGFDEKTATKGLGLQSIRNRVTSCNGKMEIFSSPNKGTETIIELKINS